MKVPYEQMTEGEREIFDLSVDYGLLDDLPEWLSRKEEDNHVAPIDSEVEGRKKLCE